jgi:hypothetical protein
MHDFIRDAPNQPASDPSASMCRHGDQVCVDLNGIIDNCVCHMPTQRMLCDRESDPAHVGCLSFQVVLQFAQDLRGGNILGRDGSRALVYKHDHSQQNDFSAQRFRKSADVGQDRFREFRVVQRHEDLFDRLGWVVGWLGQTA